MKKVFVLLLIVFQLMFVGCKTNTNETSNIPENNEELQENVNALTEEMGAIKVKNNDLIEENGILIEKNESMAEQIRKIESQNESLIGERDKVMEENALLKESSNLNASYGKEYSFLKNQLSYCALLPEIYQKNITNVFHPSVVKVGDEVAGLKVCDIEDKGYAKVLTFNGEFEVKLKVSKNELYSEEVSFEVVQDYDDKVAQDIYSYSKNYHMTYDLQSSAKEILDEIGDAYYDGIEITVILDNYSISCDMSNYVNWAHFVKLISID